MLTLLGISLVLAAGPAAGPKPLDPGVEAVLAFVTDGKGMTRLRTEGVVARLQAIIPVRQTQKEENAWTFEGTAATGAVASAKIYFEYGPEFMDADFNLRSAAGAELRQALITRLKSKLGKPAFVNGGKGESYSSVGWYIGRAWEVSVRYDKGKPGEVRLEVTQYREPEEGGGG